MSFNNSLVPDELLQQLVDKYGVEEQLLQTSGECGELVAIIQNYLRAVKYGHRTETLADVVEEAVDVFFMCQQIRFLDRQLFDSIAHSKQTKIYRKIDNEHVKKEEKS